MNSIENTKFLQVPLHMDTLHVVMYLSSNAQTVYLLVSCYLRCTNMTWNTYTTRQEQETQQFENYRHDTAMIQDKKN